MQPVPSKVRLLTPSEQQVLKLIASGLSSKEIAAALDIKFKTAVCHRTRILEKLDLHCTADLTRYAMRNELLRNDVEGEERLRRDLRRCHQKYMEALTNYNDFLNEHESLGLANPDSSEGHASCVVWNATGTMNIAPPCGRGRILCWVRWIRNSGRVAEALSETGTIRPQASGELRGPRHAARAMSSSALSQSRFSVKTASSVMIAFGRQQGQRPIERRGGSWHCPPNTSSSASRVR
jgi:DNA-binding CsgD family transcriptional regulator